MALFYMHGVPIGYVAILLALVASMGGFIFGYDTGQISDILLMSDFRLRFATCSTPGDAGTCKFSVVRAGLIVSLLSIGTLVGALAGAPTADFLGRRYAMVCECGLFIVGVIIQITSTNVWQQFAVGRWVSGLAVGALSAAVPMSPRWLAAHDRFEEARHSLARSHGIHVEDEHTNEFLENKVQDIRINIEHERQLRAGWIDCFRPANKTLYRTVLGMSLQSFQQLTGANYFFYYGATIFTSVGIQDSFVTQIILGAVNFVCTFGGLYVMQRFGRRLPLIIGGIWQSCWLFVFAAAGTTKIPQDNPGIGKLMIVSACMFILGYAMTWAPGVWILIGESFPTRTRAKQGALSTASNWFWNFLLAFFTPFIVSAIEFRYGFVFAACNLAGAIFVYFFLYESSDLSLESVDQMYNDPSCKPWTSRHWAPPGYASRYDIIQHNEAADANKPVGSEFDESRIENPATRKSAEKGHHDTIDEVTV
ncbi:hypothetical protein H0H81_012603 [Sphagnurus paluster]|uniref:Major facilitator superfamily (MFS) profile domain-containing protein n=1 Tax=Sphagnurus paluster TaxID=117069 RepID=A0A9P7GHX4_9AGAR|nr:hypothetical protein H0H81_012603 [Sphagnurus paluster]